MILKMLKVAYPTYFRSISKDDQLLMIETWGGMLSEEEPQLVMNAIKAWIAKKQFMPTIAEIKKMVANQMPKIECTDYYHERFGYGDETIYFDDGFLNSVHWEDVPKDIRERMEYHCNPKDYESYNAVARTVIEVTGNTSVKIYTSMDTEFLKGKMVTWTNEVMAV